MIRSLCLFQQKQANGSDQRIEGEEITFPKMSCLIGIPLSSVFRIFLFPERMEKWVMDFPSVLLSNEPFQSIAFTMMKPFPVLEGWIEVSLCLMSMTNRLFFYMGMYFQQTILKSTEILAYSSPLTRKRVIARSLSELNLEWLHLYSQRISKENDVNTSCTE